MLDLMFLYNNFYEDLPEQVGVFKAKLNKLIPHLYDNKHMINTRTDL